MRPRNANISAAKNYRDKLSTRIIHQLLNSELDESMIADFKYEIARTNARAAEATSEPDWRSINARLEMMSAMLGLNESGPTEQEATAISPGSRPST